MVQAYPCLMLRRDLTKGPYGTGFLSLLDCQEQQAHILADEDLVINFDQDNILGEGLRSTMVNNFSKDLLTASSHPALRLWNRLAGQGGSADSKVWMDWFLKKIQENAMVPIPNDLEFSVRIFNSNGWIVIGGQSTRLRKKPEPQLGLEGTTSVRQEVLRFRSCFLHQPGVQGI